MADILDRGRDSAVTDIQVSIFGSNVVVKVSAFSEISMAMWKMRTVRDDFQKAFGRNLTIDGPCAQE